MSARSSNRGYFSLRYAIPGYTFILLVIVINFVPLLAFFKETGAREVFGAILAFVTLLAGSALGFLVSQFWWFRFHWKGGILGSKEFKNEKKLLEEKCKNLPKKEKEKQIVMEAILDLTLFLEKEKKLLELVWRRWDIYHVLSSTYHTLWIGLIVGMGLRVYFQELVYKDSVLNYLGKLTVIFQNAESLALLLVFAGVVILLLLFRKERQNLMVRYQPLHEALVRRSMDNNKGELMQAFPDYFPKKPDSKNKT